VNQEDDTKGMMMVFGKMQLLALAPGPLLLSTVPHKLFQDKAKRHWTTPTLRQAMRFSVTWHSQIETGQCDSV